MTNHVSAPMREDTPHETETTEITHREKIEALAEVICDAGDKAAGALFVLMGTLQNSTEPEALAHAAKHFAFTQCGDLNLYGMVDQHRVGLLVTPRTMEPEQPGRAVNGRVGKRNSTKGHAEVWLQPHDPRRQLF